MKNPQKVEPATDEDVLAAQAERLQAMTDEEELRLQARSEAAQRQSGRGWDASAFLGTTVSLARSLKRERREQPWLVHQMIGAKHNCSISGSNGVGKTLMGLNLVRSLVDGEPFLDAQTNLPEGSRVAWWNGEMDPDDFNDYARPLAVRNKTRVLVKHLRDFRVSLMNDVVAETVAKELRTKEVAVWCVDSWARLCAWAGLSENKNEDVAQLTYRIDEIKRQAGVSAFVVLAHVKRGKPEEGDEAARGAMTFDDWVDSRWAYVMPDRGKHERFLYTYKVRNVRDADLVWGREIKLADDHSLSYGDARRGSGIDREYLAEVVAAVEAAPGESGTAIAKALGTTLAAGGNKVSRHLAQAENEGLVHHESGPRGAKLWRPGTAEPVKHKAKKGTERPKREG